MSSPSKKGVNTAFMASEKGVIAAFMAFEKGVNVACSPPKRGIHREDEKGSMGLHIWYRRVLWSVNLWGIHEIPLYPVAESTPLLDVNLRLTPTSGFRFLFLGVRGHHD